MPLSPPSRDTARPPLAVLQRMRRWRPSGAFIVVIIYTLLTLPRILHDVHTPCVPQGSVTWCYSTSFFWTLPGSFLLMSWDWPVALFISLSFALNVLLVYGLAKGFIAYVKHPIE